MKKTRQDVDALIDNWKADPCWDLETTEGFEEYYDELLEYRQWKEIEWREERKSELVEFAEDLGIPSNLALAQCLMDLKKLVNKINDRLDQAEER